MSKFTFIEYLTELMVSDDPQQAMMDVKQAIRDPDRYKKQQRAKNMDSKREIQQADNDPNKSEKLRVQKLKQQLADSQKRLDDKEKRQVT